MKKITDTENYRRYLSTNQVEYLLDNHTTEETERPLWEVFYNTLDGKGNQVDYLEDWLDELSTNDCSLNDFLDDWKDSYDVNGTDFLIRCFDGAKTRYKTADRLQDLFTVDDWKTMFDIASDEVMQDLLKELN